MSVNELPDELWRHIFTFVDDPDIRRHFKVYSRIAPDDYRYDMLLNRPLIRQIHGKYLPTTGSYGPSYGDVVIPRYPYYPFGDLHITVIVSRSGYVCRDDFTEHMFKGVTLRNRFVFPS